MPSQNTIAKIPFQSNHDELAVRQAREEADWAREISASPDTEILKQP